MNNLTNEQIARVFAMYWGCEFIYGEPSEHSAIRHFEGMLTGQPAHFQEWQNVLRWGAHQFKFESCKLLLTPLSAISDEDIENVAQIMGCERHLTYQFMTDFMELIINDEAEFDGQITWNLLAVFQVSQYLIQKGYAVPLFIEVGHPDNGKTAIELGLAIEKEIQP